MCYDLAKQKGVMADYNAKRYNLFIKVDLEIEFLLDLCAYSIHFLCA